MTLSEALSYHHGAQPTQHTDLRRAAAGVEELLPPAPAATLSDG